MMKILAADTEYTGTAAIGSPPDELQVVQRLHARNSAAFT